MDTLLNNMELVTKLSLLVAFVLFIPVSAIFYYFSRNSQRNSEIERYMEILCIEKRDMFQQHHSLISLVASALFLTLLASCFWGLILFGQQSELVMDPNFFLGGVTTLKLDPIYHCNEIALYQSGALLTFNMAFMGAFLWGIQNISIRYSMNDLIPSAYYNIAVRMIFAGILALVFYHLSKMMPDILAAMFGNGGNTGSGAGNGEGVNTGDVSTNTAMPVIAFLIGLFPQRGLKWLTERFAIFAVKPDPSVRVLPLEMVEGVNLYDRLRLQELGIDSCYDLANIDYVPYLFKLPYSPRILINWILQAKLCVYFGEHVRDLRDHGIHTVWQLKDRNFDDDKLKDLVKASALTEDTLTLVKLQISKDDEIERLIEAQKKLSRYWNRNDEGEDDCPEPAPKRDES